MRITGIDCGTVSYYCTWDSKSQDVAESSIFTPEKLVMAGALIVVETPDPASGIPSCRAKGLYPTFLAAGKAQGGAIALGKLVMSVSPERVRYDMLGIEGHPSGIDDSITNYLWLHMKTQREELIRGRMLGSVDKRDACLTALWGWYEYETAGAKHFLKPGELSEFKLEKK